MNESLRTSDDVGHPDPANPKETARDKATEIWTIGYPIVHATVSHQDSGDDMVTSKNLCYCQRHTSIPGQDRKRVENKPKKQSWKYQDRHGCIALGKRARLRPPFSSKAKLGHCSVPGSLRLELASELERCLTLVIFGEHLAAAFHDFGDTGHIPLDYGPVDGCQAAGIRLVRISAVAKKQVDGKSVALIASPLQTSSTIAIGCIGQDGELLREQIRKEYSRGRVRGKMKCVEALSVGKGGISTVPNKKMDNVDVTVPGGREENLSKSVCR
jgi:hypothetical protein